MVTPQVYLFIGQDPLAKEEKIKKIRQGLLKKETAAFNSDIFYGSEITLKELQERLLYRAAKSLHKLVVIKEAQELTLEIKDFLVKYISKIPKDAILVLDIADRYNPKDAFINQIRKYAQVLRFQEEPYLNTFDLARNIEQRKAANSLKILNQLLENGERPERILGGLRYVWENRLISPLKARKALRALLNCDINIKTGRIKPDFALERLVVSLCHLG